MMLQFIASSEIMMMPLTILMLLRYTIVSTILIIHLTLIRIGCFLASQKTLGISLMPYIFGRANVTFYVFVFFVSKYQLD